ncbi:MAG: endonuclease/exonuclease/phosphatase family protein [Leptolyngbyaceae cyanobacterium]
MSTYNILNSNKNIDGLLAVIEQADSDLLAIQELTERLRSQIMDRLTQAYPYYYVSTPIRGGTTALFSKLPLMAIAELDFGINRPAVIATTTVDGREITVISAHLNPIYYALNNRPLKDMPRAIQQYIRDQNKQAKLLIDVLQDYESDAFILGCDCNSRATASTNKILEHFFLDAANVVGWGLGNTPIEASVHEHDLNRIDYIWYAGALKTKGVYRIANSGGSDHQLIFSDFSWQ